MAETLFSNAIWWNYSTYTKGYWSVSYDYQRSGSSMQYRFTWSVSISSGAYFNDAFKLTLNVNGTNSDVTVKGTGGGSGWSYSGTTGWFTIADKTSGSTPFSISIINTSTGQTRATQGPYYLYVAPSKATLTSAADFNDEQNPTFSYSNPGGFLVEPYLKFCNPDGSVGLTITGYSGTSIGNNTAWNIDNYRTQIRNFLTARSSCSVIYGIRTTISGALFYDESSAKTFSIINAAPIVSAVMVDDNSVSKAVTGNQNIMIRYVSRAKITVTPTVKKGATIKSLVVNGTSVPNGNILYIDNITTTPLLVTLIDSRNDSATFPLNPTVWEYIPLTTSPNIYRQTPTNGKIILSVNGNAFKGSFGSSPNVLNVAFRWKETGAADNTYSGWTLISPTQNDGNTYTYSALVGTENGSTARTFDYQKDFTFQIYATDRFNTTQTITVPVPKGQPIMDWGKNDIAFHKVVNMDVALPIASGGTNSKTVSGAINNLGLGLSSYSVIFDLGGTNMVCRLTKHGKTVICNIYRYSMDGSNLNSGSALVTIPSEYKPAPNCLTDYEQPLAPILFRGDYGASIIGSISLNRSDGVRVFANYGYVPANVVLGGQLTWVVE